MRNILSRPIMCRLSIILAVVMLCGCSVLLPDALLPNETVVIEEAISPWGDRVTPGTSVELVVRYKIDSYAPERKYYLIVCALEQCADPRVAVPITSRKGRIRVTFVQPTSTAYASIVVGEPRERRTCEAFGGLENCTGRATNSLGGAMVPLEVSSILKRNWSLF